MTTKTELSSPAPAPDEAVRQRALDCTRSFIVQAPAGSGKTELLIQRLLKLLARVERPEEIVAITFTIKAAAEMQERILHALLRAGDDAPPTDPHARASWTYARAALEHDRKQGWNLTSHPARLPIMTIDAFCAGVVRRMPVTSGLGPLSSVTEDALPLYREAARRTFAEARARDLSGAWSTLLAHLDNRIPSVLELIALLLSQRDQWLKHLVGARPDRALRARLEAVLEREIGLALAHAAHVLARDLLVRAQEFAAVATAHLRAEGKESPFAALAEAENFPAAGPEHQAAWRGLCELVFTGENAWRRRFDSALGFPGATAAKGEEKARRQRMKAGMQLLVAQLAAVPELREALIRVRCLPPPHYDDEQWAVVEALLRLLPHAAAQLQLTFAQAGKMDFNQVQLAALRALGGEGEPTDLLLALDHRIRHILVDEFQDTSATQHELLMRLTAGWEAEDGRTLFLVGDPMQSIYRFREAEVGLYLQVREQGMGPLTLEPLILSANFRSQANLVDWVNARLSGIFPEHEDVEASAVKFCPAAALRAALPLGVSVHRAYDYSEEAQCVLEAIREARGRDPGATIAVLVRARKHVDHVVTALRSAGVSFQAVDIDPLATRPFILDLLALTFALLYRADTVSWLAILRAPWCGLSLADLTVLTAGEEEVDVYLALRDPERQARLSEDGRRRIERLLSILETAVIERGRTPLAPYVRGVWLGLGGPACLSDAARLEDVETFFAVLEEHAEGAELPDRDAFLAALELFYAAPDARSDARLQIMTMHKAKGLEFDTVILPGLHRRPGNGEAPLLRWRSPAGSGLMLAPVKARGGAGDPIYDYLGLLEANEEDHETSRLVYVAVTRAKSRVHLIAVWPADRHDRTPDKGSLLAKLWPAIGAELQALSTPASMPAVAGEKATLKRLPLTWARPAAPPGLKWTGLGGTEILAGDRLEFDWVRESARHVGTLVHRLLLQIGREGIAHWSPERIEGLCMSFAVELGRLGVPSQERERAVGRVVSALLATLDDPRGKWLFDSTHRESSGELALSAVIDGRVVQMVLDRTFVDARGTRWIVDFKTSSHEGGEMERFLDSELERYREQLEAYGKMWRMREEGGVKLGLYFPLLRGWREWDG